MRATTLLARCIVALGCVTLYSSVGASAALAARQAPATATEGIRAELLSDLATLETKYIGLAEAMSQEQYGWRPADGVRSVSEVFMHVAGSTFFITDAIGFEQPDDLGVEAEVADFEEITDKAQVIAALQSSFDHVRDGISATPDERLEESIAVFGQERTVRAVLLLIANHMHEHLGQMIAYARTIGVVPPWSEGE